MCRICLLACVLGGVKILQKLCRGVYSGLLRELVLCVIVCRSYTGMGGRGGVVSLCPFDHLTICPLGSSGAHNPLQADHIAADKKKPPEGRTIPGVAGVAGVGVMRGCPSQTPPQPCDCAGYCALPSRTQRHNHRRCRHHSPLPILPTASALLPRDRMPDRMLHQHNA